MHFMYISMQAFDIHTIDIYDKFFVCLFVS